MQTTEGRRAWVWTPAWPGRSGGQTQVTRLAQPRPLRICAARAQGLPPPPHTGGWLARRPSSWGVAGMFAGGEGPPGSQTHPYRSCVGLAGVTPRPGLQEVALCHCLSTAQCRLGRGHAISVRDTECPRTATPLPIGGRGSPPATAGEGPGVPVLARKEVEPRAHGRETGLGALGQLRGGRTGRQTGDGVFGAWQMQGLIAGPSRGPDPGTSSGCTGGNSGTGPGPSPPSSLNPPFPRVSRAPGRLSWAVVGLTPLPGAPRRRLPGKWGTSGWPSATCPRTWCGTRGCRGGLGAAAAPRSR